MIDVEKPGVKSAQEPVNENRKKELANTENISGARASRLSLFHGLAPVAKGLDPSGVVLMQSGLS